MDPRVPSLLALALAACSFDGAPAISGPSDGGNQSDAPVSDTDGGEIDASPTCPDRYVPNSTGTCYRFVTTGANWLDAQADCTDDAVGAHLIVVNDSAEDAQLPDFHWIGYSEYISEGTFLWVTGATASSYEAFEPPDPDSINGAFCTVTRPGGWHDDQCGEQKDYICEFDGIATDLSTY